MSDTPSNNETNPQPFDIETVSDLRGLRLFLERYERDILRPIELPAVQSAYWFANRGQFRELLELDAELSANVSLMPFARASLSVGREQLRLLKPMYDQRMMQRFRKCVVAGEARGWNPIVFGMFLSIHSVPVREGLLQFGRQIWSGFVNGVQAAAPCRMRSAARCSAKPSTVCPAGSRRSSPSRRGKRRTPCRCQLIMKWTDGQLWRRSAINTLWCLIGCSIGDMGVIAGFQFGAPEVAASRPMLVMALAMTAGIGTSVLLETILLFKQLGLPKALRTALGMSMISMLGMETAMNVVDYFLAGGARLTLWVLPLMWLAGFLAPWPYNYWRLAKHGKSCCHAE